MTLRVIDTNVLVVAAERPEDPWSRDDIDACIEALLPIADGLERVVVDVTGLIVAEYVQQLGHSGMPMLGHAIAKHLHDRQFDRSVCEPVHIAVNDDAVAVLPELPALSGFDPSDRKFAAASLAHPDRPAVLNAVDTDWWLFRDALGAIGVSITFLCAETIRRLAGENN